MNGQQESQAVRDVRTGISVVAVGVAVVFVLLFMDFTQFILPAIALLGAAPFIIRYRVREAARVRAMRWQAPDPRARLG